MEEAALDISFMGTAANYGRWRKRKLGRFTE
jgi:hypothetical protein